MRVCGGGSLLRTASMIDQRWKRPSSSSDHGETCGSEIRRYPPSWRHERLRAVLLLLERRLAADELEALGQLAALAQVGGETGRHLAPPAEGDAAERLAAALPPRRQLAIPGSNAPPRRRSSRPRCLRQRPRSCAAGSRRRRRRPSRGRSPRSRRAPRRAGRNAAFRARRLLRRLRRPRSSNSSLRLGTMRRRPSPRWHLGRCAVAVIAGRAARFWPRAIRRGAARSCAGEDVNALNDARRCGGVEGQPPPISLFGSSRRVACSADLLWVQRQRSTSCAPSRLNATKTDAAKKSR